MTDGDVTAVEVLLDLESEIERLAAKVRDLIQKEMERAAVEQAAETEKLYQDA
jgi:hypothetical protein